MVKGLTKLFVAAVTVAAISGCASSEKSVGSMTVKRYKEDRPRVDQELSGNSGYLYGTPQQSTAERKPTRRIYYVEFSKENKESKSNVVEKTYTLPERRQRTSDDESMNTGDLPDGAYSYSEIREPAAYGDTSVNVTRETVISDTAPVAPSADLPQQYVVTTDDTLQKISKKFYGSYSKWNKIYEANKDVIQNPDRINAGTTITIPEL